MRTVIEGDYVPALYDRDWYIEKVTDIDYTDNEVEVSFMQKNEKSLYQWPRNPDVIWIEKDNVFVQLTHRLSVANQK